MTQAQLRYMRAIRDFFEVDGWYPGIDDLLKLLGQKGSNGVVEVLGRLEDQGLIEWPLSPKGPRRCGDTLTRRASSIRLTDKGHSALEAS